MLEWGSQHMYRRHQAAAAGVGVLGKGPLARHQEPHVLTVAADLVANLLGGVALELDRIEAAVIRSGQAAGCHTCQQGADQCALQQAAGPRHGGLQLGNRRWETLGG